MTAAGPSDPLYEELAYYTLAHGDPAFLHQHVVDAWGAQTAGPETKLVRLAFSLVGLYLYLEKGFTGRRVQQAHMRIAARRKDWPHFDLPQERGDITVADVLAAAPGPECDAMIRRWCESVWAAYGAQHEQVAALWREISG